METPIFRAEKCPLTGVLKPNLKHLEIKIPEGAFSRRGFQWFYPFNNDVLLIVEGDLFEDQFFWDANRSAIYYLIENKIWPSGRMVDKPLFEALISSSNIPKTPIEKLKELVSFFSIESRHLGKQITIARRDSERYLRKLGFDHQDELEALIQECKNRGYIELKGQSDLAISLILSLSGWNVAEERNQLKQSNIAFIAMSFDPEMIQIYNSWIEPAIKESGYEPYIVLDQHPESDVTINDAILAGIKKAKFTIADFTHHKSGVYFEAGFALGRGQKVIYTCQEDHIGTAHFDTRNYQHLVWKDGADLKKKLMDKIEVFIKS